MSKFYNSKTIAQKIVDDYLWDKDIFKSRPEDDFFKENDFDEIISYLMEEESYKSDLLHEYLKIELCIKTAFKTGDADDHLTLANTILESLRDYYKPQVIVLIHDAYEASLSDYIKENDLKRHEDNQTGEISWAR